MFLKPNSPSPSPIKVGLRDWVWALAPVIGAVALILWRTTW